MIVTLDSLLMAYGHASLALFIGSFFSTGGLPSRPPPAGMSPGGFNLFFGIGAFFLFATIIYILGAIFVASGKLSKLSYLGLIIMAVVDNILLVYTRLDPGNVFFNRIVHWSWGWFPRLGTVQVLVGQAILIVLCVSLLIISK